MSKIEDMQGLAEQRSNYFIETGKPKSEADYKFIQMAIDNFDGLMNVVEAARAYFTASFEETQYWNPIVFKSYHAVKEALEALENA
jgi:uncharacterized protein (UPF0128 family)